MGQIAERGGGAREEDIKAEELGDPKEWIAKGGKCISKPITALGARSSANADQRYGPPVRDKKERV
jgi:hypothetical protein